MLWVSTQRITVADGLLAAEDGADGVVEVVRVEGEVDVAGLDEEDERLGRVLAESTVRAASAIWARVGWASSSAGRVDLGGGRAALPVQAGGRVVAAVGGAIGEMVELAGAEEAEEPGSALRGGRRGLAERLCRRWCPARCCTQTYLPPFLTSMAARSASVRKRLPGTAFLPWIFRFAVAVA